MQQLLRELMNRTIKKQDVAQCVLAQLVEIDEQRLSKFLTGRMQLKVKYLERMGVAIQFIETLADHSDFPICFPDAG
jgi:hypothetical protein